MVEAISKDPAIETATKMENVICRLLLSHNRGTVKLFKLLYLNRADVSAAFTEFLARIVQVERLFYHAFFALCSSGLGISIEK